MPTSTQTTIIALATAAIGVATGYGLSSNSSTSTCPNPSTNHISLVSAQKLIADYVADSTCGVLDSAGVKLRGWRIEKCDLEYIFQQYPTANGIQLYVGKKQNNANTLVWVANELIANASEDFTNIPNTIMDMTTGCPERCPTKSQLYVP